jgi:class 3 adenylate cyclase/tetratricopeptide (TPR) repeat protein
MRCRRCGALSSAEMVFCGQCGAELPIPCPSCRAENPPEHKFCGQCGASLPPRRDHLPRLPERSDDPPAAVQSQDKANALPGEIKQVTVLFCDIVNSTPLTERLGSEAMRDLVRDFLDASLGEVRRYGGTAPQFTGDGFMAIFGAPVAEEDHVRRALLAAVAIRRVLGGGEEPAVDGGLDLPVRIGIHTGPVVFGPIADEMPIEYTVIGDTANVAARLQQAAEPGWVLVSEAVQQIAQGYAHLEPIGPLNLKGKLEPIRAFRLIGVSHRRAGLRESPSPRMAAFVDRVAELAVVNHALAQVEDGRGQVIGIVGEPGIGKSRLVAEFRSQLSPERVTWVEGRCLSYGTAIPYLLALDLLRSTWGIVEGDASEAIADKVHAGLQAAGMDSEESAAVLLHLFQIKIGDSPPALSNPEAVKAKAFELLRQLSIKTSQRRTMVLLLEDLHWVDKVSEELLGLLADDVRNARILLLASYRPGYRPPWIEKSYAGQVAVQPLSRSDSVEMVRSVLHAERLVERVTEEIVATADGNPFFLEQLALHAGEVGPLRANPLVPETVHDVVMARIDRLPDEGKRLLQTAAVIGREFSLRLLRPIWQGAGSLENHLRELCRLEFIDERGAADEAVFVFRHALTQETAYASLLERQRRARHGVVGRALEDLYCGRADEVAELLALHFGRSNEGEKAVDYAILAAEKSQRRWANNEALGYFDDALHRLDLLADTAGNRRRRIDAVIKQAEVKFALGRHAEHVEALDRIRGLVDESGDPRRLATWHYWRGFLHVLTAGRPEIAIDHCHRAASLAANADIGDVKAFAESCLAQVYLIAGRLRDAIAAGERALSSFEARGDLGWACRTIWHLHPAALALGEWGAAIDYCRRALEHAVTLDDPRFKVVGLWRTGAAHVHRGDARQGIEYCNEALALDALPFDAAMAKAVRGYGEVKAGEVDAGIADLREAVAWFENFRLGYTYARYATWLAEGHLRRGDPAAAQSLIRNLLKVCRDGGYRHLEGVALWLMAECLAIDDAAAAEPCADAAMEILEEVDARNDLARAAITRAALRQASGDVAAARADLARSDAIFRHLGTLAEPARVAAACAALDCNAPIGFLGARA